MKLENTIKIILIIMLLLCLLHMPYSYYMLTRAAALIGFSTLAYLEYKKNSEVTLGFILFVILAILFQPICKISLGRLAWNTIDAATAIWLIYSIIKSRKQ